jgi:PAS domain S-box-containing protein
MEHFGHSRLFKRLLVHDKIPHLLAGSGIGLRDFSTGETLASSVLLNLGYDKASIGGDAWLQFVHGKDRPRLTQIFAQVQSGERDTVDEEFRIQNQAGDWLWIRHRATVLERDKLAQPTLYVGVDIDITDLRGLAETFEQRYTEAEMLRVAGAILSTELDHNRAVEQVLEQAHYVMPFDVAYVWLLSGNHLEYAGGRNPLAGVRQTIHRSEPDYAQVLESRHPMLENFADNQAETAFAARLAVPLVIKNEVIGCIDFLRRLRAFCSPGTFGQPWLLATT